MAVPTELSSVDAGRTHCVSWQVAVTDPVDASFPRTISARHSLLAFWGPMEVVATTFDPQVQPVRTQSPVLHVAVTIPDPVRVAVTS